MALPSSGALSLNAIHIEAGGSSGTLCSINDSDIRGLIGKSSGATMSFNEWYGASAALTLNGTGTYYNETGTYGSSYDGLRTRATGNSTYPYIGVVREPYNGTNYYHMIQGVSVAATLNSATSFKVAYASSSYATVSGPNWSSYTYTNGKVITYNTGGKSGYESTAYAGLSSNYIYFQFPGL